MIFKESKLFVGDNTGIKKGLCLRIYKKKTKRAGLGDVILFVIKKIKRKKKYIKKIMYLGLIINIKKKTRRIDGIYLSFARNVMLTLSETFRFMGTRVKGPVCREVSRAPKKKRLLLKRVIKYTKGYL